MEHRNEIKEAILNCGLDRQVSQARRKAVFQADTSELEALWHSYGFDVVSVALAVLYGTWKKEQRVKQRTSDIVLGGHALFLTLTFTDETLANTSAETRRKYVRRFLKAQCPVYVANIDFGEKNEREHYHALVRSDRIDYKPWHKYGAIKGERVQTSDVDLTRTAKYIAKLSKHAIKKTAGKGVRIIYSRNVLPPPQT